MRKCPCCSARIFSHTALCVNKKDISRAYGCPNCGQFLLIPKSKLDSQLVHTVTMLPLLIYVIFDTPSKELMTLWWIALMYINTYIIAFTLLKSLKLSTYRSKDPKFSHIEKP